MLQRQLPLYGRAMSFRVFVAHGLILFCGFIQFLIIKVMAACDTIEFSHQIYVKPGGCEDIEKR